MSTYSVRSCTPNHESLLEGRNSNIVKEKDESGPKNSELRSSSVALLNPFMTSTYDSLALVLTLSIWITFTSRIFLFRSQSKVYLWFSLSRRRTILTGFDPFSFRRYKGPRKKNDHKKTCLSRPLPDPSP